MNFKKLFSREKRNDSPAGQPAENEPLILSQYDRECETWTVTYDDGKLRRILKFTPEQFDGLITALRKRN